MPPRTRNQVGGADRIRTGESRICSPLPYHLATAPLLPAASPDWRQGERKIITPRQRKSIIRTVPADSPIAGQVVGRQTAGPQLLLVNAAGSVSADPRGLTP